jgi:uncharacterized protein YxeA
MKKFLLLIVGLALAAPGSAYSIQEFKRTGEIQKDETGSYTETQRDYHKRRTKQIKDKTGAGYYDGTYHSKSPEYQQGEWQFVDSASGSQKSSAKDKQKKGKKKKATHKKKKQAE